MALATKKPDPSSRGPRSKSAPTSGESGSWLIFAFDRLYKFLASLNLAVLSLSILVIYLSVGMLFERWYGNQALQDYFYRTWYFALLLGILGMNILCAALIRFPWKKRQTGFVVTHAGLLVLIVGSWISFQVGDEGQIGMVEGDASQTLVGTTNYRLRVQPVDPETGQPRGDGYAFPFYPGAFNWDPERSEVLTRQDDPFKLTVESFYPASSGKLAHRSADPGVPMIRLGAFITPPNSTTPMNLFQADSFDQQKWLVADAVFLRKVKNVGPAQFRFSYADLQEEPHAVSDFLDLPEKGLAENAWLRYVDGTGRERSARFFPDTKNWTFDDGGTATGVTTMLPGSALEVTYKLSGSASEPDVFERLRTQFQLGPAAGGHSTIRLVDFLMTIVNGTGDQDVPMIEFEVKAKDQAPLIHWGLPISRVSTLAFQPSSGDATILEPAKKLLSISYYMPPTFSEGMQGTKGVIEVLGTNDGKVHYRSLNDEGVQGQGALRLGEPEHAFGGTPNQPMTIDFSVDEYLRSGREEFIFVPIELPVGQAGNGIPASKIKISSGEDTGEAWVRLGITPDLKPDPRETRTVKVGDRAYQVWFDVDRKPLPFELKLVDFRRRYDPGTQQARSYESDVLLTDESQGIKDKKITISMNEPLTHRGYTFYQSSFDPPNDASGQFVSVFQVRYDPTWLIVYLGCLMVVIGTFLQFYMRAGIFTDGGKRERQIAEAKKAKSRRKGDLQENVEPVPVASSADADIEL